MRKSLPERNENTKRKKEKYKNPTKEIKKEQLKPLLIDLKFNQKIASVEKNRRNTPPSSATIC